MCWGLCFRGSEFLRRYICHRVLPLSSVCSSGLRTPQWSRRRFVSSSPALAFVWYALPSGAGATRVPLSPTGCHSKHATLIYLASSNRGSMYTIIMTTVTIRYCCCIDKSSPPECSAAFRPRFLAIQQYGHTAKARAVITLSQQYVLLYFYR